MPHRPSVIAFDVIETLFSLDPLKSKLKDAGLPKESLQTWYARLMRDAMTLDSTGDFHDFREVASVVLEGVMAEHSIEAGEDQIEKILDGMAELTPYPDVQSSLELLRSAGVPAMALTNGSAENTAKLFRRAGMEHLVKWIVSIDQVKRWKPSRAVYLEAVVAAGVENQDLALVAAHAWDLHGAHAAGLTTAWLPRTEKRFSRLMTPPDVKGGTLLEVVQALLELPTR